MILKIIFYGIAGFFAGSGITWWISWFLGRKARPRGPFAEYRIIDEASNISNETMQEISNERKYFNQMVNSKPHIIKIYPKEIKQKLVKKNKKRRIKKSSRRRR